jgi:hypothetical protein
MTVGQNKSPTKNAEPTQKHKTLMIFSSPEDDINILAFFQVVASGQISPHFRAAKLYKFSDIQYLGKYFLEIS